MASFPATDEVELNWDTLTGSMQPPAPSEKSILYIPEEHAYGSVVFLDEHRNSYQGPPSTPEPDYLKGGELCTWMQDVWAADLLVDFSEESRDVLMDWANRVSYPESPSATGATGTVQTWEAPATPLQEEVELPFKDYHDWILDSRPATPMCHLEDSNATE